MYDRLGTFMRLGKYKLYGSAWMQFNTNGVKNIKYAQQLSFGFSKLILINTSLLSKTCHHEIEKYKVNYFRIHFFREVGRPTGFFFMCVEPNTFDALNLCNKN